MQISIALGGSVDQWVRHLATDPEVPGSIPGPHHKIKVRFSAPRTTQPVENEYLG